MLELFAVYDKKAKMYGQPFAATHTTEAVRQIASVASDPKTMLNKYPEDFSLVQLASYDQNTGALKCPAFPETICQISTLVPEKSDYQPPRNPAIPHSETGAR